ncbi:MAG: hypothetical protein JSU06_05935 [Actinobacteria bacterium]|nr:hypothetical protein [Actinomycetota bacterium]
MNPNQINVANTMVAQHELLEEARRSRLRAAAERENAQNRDGRTTFHAHPLSGLLGLASHGRR